MATGKNTKSKAKGLTVIDSTLSKTVQKELDGIKLAVGDIQVGVDSAQGVFDEISKSDDLMQTNKLAICGALAMENLMVKLESIEGRIFALCKPPAAQS